VAIDRRFYRLRYDAEQATGAFSRQLGQEVDLEIIQADLVRAVVQTVQPERVGVWRRDSARATLGGPA
jgi:hypothetical protein